MTAGPRTPRTESAEEPPAPPADAVGEGHGWTIVVDPTADRGPGVWASLLALSSGAVGVRAGSEDRGDVDHHVLVAGAYGLAADGLVRLLPGPACTLLDERTPPGRCRWILDLRAGTVERAPVDGGLRSLRFASLARPGVVVVTGDDADPGRPWSAPLVPPTVASGPHADHDVAEGTDRGRCWLETASDRSHVTAVADQRAWEAEGRRHVARVVAVRAGDGSQLGAAHDLLEQARAVGVDGLLDEHRVAWHRRWEDADIEIDGDPVAQRGIRYALFHLLSCAPTTGASAVGARGLTGMAYAGHVFWDTDVFVLPALAAVLPDAAASILRYRTERLDVARANAAELGLGGARYPWESADSGRDVTPTSTRDLEGRIVPIRTGQDAEHVNADVAWAIHHFLAWTGDRDGLDGAAEQVVLETARFWLSRVRTDESGRAHLLGVVGPDEYHEPVDDNAYTNVMARWHLRWAAALARRVGDEEEAEAFSATADALVDGFDPVTRRHEQFAGFWDLEPLLIGDLATPPVAADVLLGRERVRRAQVLKQPDVLMAHHLVPDEMPAGSRRADLDFYLPRIAHGSSLSPAICAAVLARDRRPNEALALFDLAARIDLDDLTNTTAGGLHLATMGGLWQAVVHGFAGIRPGEHALAIDPALPERWTRCAVRLHYRGMRVRVSVTADAVEVDSDEPVQVLIRGRAATAPTRAPLGPRPEELR